MAAPCSCCDVANTSWGVWNRAGVFVAKTESHRPTIAAKQYRVLFASCATNVMVALGYDTASILIAAESHRAPIATEKHRVVAAGRNACVAHACWKVLGHAALAATIVPESNGVTVAPDKDRVFVAGGSCQIAHTVWEFRHVVLVAVVAAEDDSEAIAAAKRRMIAPGRREDVPRATRGLEDCCLPILPIPESNCLAVASQDGRVVESTRHGNKTTGSACRC
mmetsp:Transcript_31590/g.87127  ORF Transcript_31590/g.87127 Transcript_31590/m.87127 type:complete len:222 (-) Transcript_31590:16-681(-)